jgi:hypothetical protein
LEALGSRVLAMSSSLCSILEIDHGYAMMMIWIQAHSGPFSHLVLHMVHCQSSWQQSGLYGNVHPRPLSFPVRDRDPFFGMSGRHNRGVQVV